jgi:glycosyltransferase involved in cell wall biosynthesis
MAGMTGIGERPLRILEVVVRFHPYIGGVENTVLELGRRLTARGHEVRVVCADEPAGSPARVEGIDVVRLPCRRRKIGNTNLCPGLAAALRRERPDLIHGHLPTALFAEAAASAARDLGVPFVLTYHNDLIGGGIKGVLVKLYNRFELPRLLARADRVVTTNPGYAAASPHLSPGDPKITCIPWGVDEEVFHPPADGGPAIPASDAPELILGFLSLLDRHHHYKGLDVLLRAVADLPGVRLKIGGAGEEQEGYRKLAGDLGLGDRVDFLGFVPELPPFYSSCHAFVLPSTDARREGFGLVLLEAMACGRPVITTPVAGMAVDIQAAEAGLVVPAGDPEALAAAIRRLHEERSLLPALGGNGRRLVLERYTWTRVADAYEALYRDSIRLPARVVP